MIIVNAKLMGRQEVHHSEKGVPWIKCKILQDQRGLFISMNPLLQPQNHPAECSKKFKYTVRTFNIADSTIHYIYIHLKKEKLFKDITNAIFFKCTPTVYS